MESQQLLSLSSFATKKNGILIITLIGLVVAENLIENDFVCPCHYSYRILFFGLYLLLPAFIIFTVTFGIMCELEKQEAPGNRENQNQEAPGNRENQNQEAPGNRENQNQEAPPNRENQNQEAPPNRENQNQEAPGNTLKCLFICQCFIPSIFWVLLFFSDGRYVACLKADLKDRYFDSSSQLPWEWCHKNQTLTPEQKDAEKAYIHSKMGGFVAFIIASALILIWKCWNEHKQQNPGDHRTPSSTNPGTGKRGTPPARNPGARNTKMQNRDWKDQQTSSISEETLLLPRVKTDGKEQKSTQITTEASTDPAELPV